MKILSETRRTISDTNIENMNQNHSTQIEFNINYMNPVSIIINRTNDYLLNQVFRIYHASFLKPLF